MSKTVLIAGGGTGGHIYPALSVVQALKQLDPGSRIFWVGSSQGMEKDILPRYQIDLTLIRIGALNSVSFFTKLKTLFFIPLAFFQTWKLFKRINPDVILGVGGYASGPAMVLGKWLKKRTILFEPNSYPGLTNRLLKPFVDLALVNFSETGRHFKKSIQVGIPVREELRTTPRPPSNKLRVFVTGGSQGARGINDAIISMCFGEPKVMDQIQLFHQIGGRDFEKLKEEYGELKLDQVEITDFVHDMADKFKWADVVVCRAGASTIAELAACQKAAILIPLPTSADNHQLKNAKVLEGANAGIVVEQKSLSARYLAQILEDMIKDPSRISALEGNIKIFFVPNCAKTIAGHLLT